MRQVDGSINIAEEFNLTRTITAYPIAPLQNALESLKKAGYMLRGNSKVVYNLKANKKFDFSANKNDYERIGKCLEYIIYSYMTECMNQSVASSLTHQ